MNNDVYSLWEEFASTGSFGPPHNGYFVNGAAAGMVTLEPYQTKEVTSVLGWYFPDRDFLGLHVGERCVNVWVEVIGVMCEGMKVIRCWCVKCEDDGHMMMASVFLV